MERRSRPDATAPPAMAEGGERAGPAGDTPP